MISLRYNEETNTLEKLIHNMLTRNKSSVRVISVKFLVNSTRCVSLP
jgi:hypothetical protein